MLFPISRHPRLGFRSMELSAGCAVLVSDPGALDVIVTDNMSGDVVTGVCCGLVGGPFMVGGGAFGEDCAVFGPVHGPQAALAGQGVANPVGCLQSAVMLLGYVGLHEAADRVRRAVEATVAKGDVGILTPDMGGRGTTKGFVGAVKAALR